VQTNGLLTALIQALQPVYKDLHASTPVGAPAPSVAYQTFFKDSKNRIYIGELLAKISRGDPVFEPTFPPQPWQEYTATGGPVILSITTRGQFLADPDGPMVDVFDWCHANPYVTGAVPLSARTPTPLIFLCPYFYDAQPPSIYGDLPPSPLGVTKKPTSNCLAINSRTNTFIKRTPATQPAGFELTQYRMWILFELLSRLYRSGDLGRAAQDVPDVNHCLRLSAEDALDNAASYSYYAASIHGNCASFPRSRRGGELLETSDPADIFDFGPLDPSTPLIKVLNVTSVQFGGPAGAKPVNATTVQPAQTQSCEEGKCYTWCICA
ncbi:MAG: hypothetical protein LQ352_008228, partial [Teloschistes flavicans]